MMEVSITLHENGKSEEYSSLHDYHPLDGGLLEQDLTQHFEHALKQLKEKREELFRSRFPESHDT